VPVDVSVKASARLKQAGIPVTLNTVDGGHGINEGMAKLFQQWLADVVRKP